MTTVLHEAQFELHPHPGNLHSGWLPRHDSAAMRAYVERVLGSERRELAPPVQALATYIQDNEVVRRLASTACAEYLAAIGAQSPRLKDVDTLLHGFNATLTDAPCFIDGELVGLPFPAFMAGVGRTVGGSALFRQPTVHLLVSNILNDWHVFLDSPASSAGFLVYGEQWLAPAVKKRYRFPLWSKDAGGPPCWNSWNAFLARGFEDPGQARPVADPESNETVVCPGDGVRKDPLGYGAVHLADLLASPVPRQQALIDDYRLLERFTGGQVFQAHLTPYDFHRWWAPVNGDVLFDPFTIPGCFFNPPVSPGARFATTPARSCQGHARGVIVIGTEDHGHVCCIPLGMSAASSVVFDPGMRRGVRVRKGQEMGMFRQGGSSFVLLFEKLPDKELVLVNADGMQDTRRQVLSSNRAVLAGARIGAWHARK